MYVGVDVGGTKTLLACLDESGNIIEKVKFATAQNYNIFLVDLAKCVANLATQKFTAGAIGVPGVIDREHGKGIIMGNLPWDNKPIREDFGKIIKCTKTLLENDAKLAGLAEALRLKDKYKNVLYITLGTGIGIANIKDGLLNLSLNDLGGKTLMLEHNNQIISWEDLASGRALTRRFGKHASELTDSNIWETYANDLALGLIELIALLQPDIIVIGGGIGAYFEKYKKQLEQALQRYATPLLPIPPICAAAQPELAVIYGCYAAIKIAYGRTVR